MENIKIRDHVILFLGQDKKNLTTSPLFNMMRRATMGIMLFFILTNNITCHSSNPGKLEVRQFTMPSYGLESIKQSECGIPIVNCADVVVAGGGVAGVVTALRAADEGLSVILLESRNYLGQEITATYKCTTSSFQPGISANLTSKIYQELEKEGIVKGKYLNPEDLRTYLHKKVAAQPLIQVYFYSLASGAICEKQCVKGVVFTDLNGRQAVLGKVVVDATEDARVSVAAGAKLTRKMTEAKTAKRFISARMPESIRSGPLEITANLGLKDDCIIIHNDIVEFSVPVVIGGDIAAGISAIQALTLEKCFSLRNYLIRQGIVMGDFRPGSETWIDEVPVVTCQSQLSINELKTLNFHNNKALMPTGFEGIVIAGRIVDISPRMGNLQALLSIGELAGQTSVIIAKKTTEFPTIENISTIKKKNTGTISVQELFDGIDPGKKYKVVSQPSVDLPIRGKFDVLVVGGGTSGAISAIAAARQGANVCLIEILPNLGGISSNRVTSYYWGVPWKSMLRKELGDKIHLTRSSNQGALEKVRFSGEDKKYALQELALRAGVHIYYQSLASGAVIEGKKVRGVIVDNASGRHVLLADVIIDATGQAGIAVAAGAEYVKGREKDGFLMEMEHGPLRDPTQIDDVSPYYLNFPSKAISLNIRESRRIVGDYVVTFEDAIHGRLFPDLVCRWRSNYDSHFPNSANQSDLAQDWTTILGLWRRPIMGSIPYRSLLPKDLDNILVVGKAYSTDHDALIGGRMQADLEHLGQAAGLAAAMASRLEIPVRDIPIQQLQAELVRSGVLRNQDLPKISVDDAPSLDELHLQDLWRQEREKQFPVTKSESESSLKEMTNQLGTDNALEAMVQLYLAGKKSISWLRPLLKSENPRIVEEAAILLGMLGDQSAIPSLLGFLKQRNTRRFEYTLPYASSRSSVPLYWSAAILLGRLGDKEAVPVLTEILSQSPPPEEFRMMRRHAYGNDMFEEVSKCPPPLASFIIVALGRIGDPKAAEYIRPFLSVSNQIGVNEEGENLEIYPIPLKLNPVAIKNENKDFEIIWGIQTNAAWALAQMGDYSGVPVLIGLLNAKQAQLRAYAQQLLETVTDKHFGSDYQAWKNWWNVND